MVQPEAERDRRRLRRPAPPDRRGETVEHGGRGRRRSHLEDRNSEVEILRRRRTAIEERELLRRGGTAGQRACVRRIGNGRIDRREVDDVAVSLDAEVELVPGMVAALTAPKIPTPATAAKAAPKVRRLSSRIAASRARTRMAVWSVLSMGYSLAEGAKPHLRAR